MTVWHFLAGWFGLAVIFALIWALVGAGRRRARGGACGDCVDLNNRRHMLRQLGFAGEAEAWDAEHLAHVLDAHPAQARGIWRQLERDIASAAASPAPPTAHPRRGRRVVQLRVATVDLAAAVRRRMEKG